MYRKKKNTVLIERPYEHRSFNVYLPGCQSKATWLGGYMCSEITKRMFKRGSGEPGPGEYGEYRLVPASSRRDWALHVRVGGYSNDRTGIMVHLTHRAAKALGVTDGRYVLEEVG